MHINNRIYVSKYKYGYNLIYYMFIDHNVVIDMNPETIKVHYWYKEKDRFWCRVRFKY